MTRPAFWDHVDFTLSCWEWNAAADGLGYGRWWFRDAVRLSHRVAWEITHGPIPDGLCVLHRCDNPKCVRPDHLFLGTQGDNIRDMHAKKRAKPARGELSSRAKLTSEQVRDIWARYTGKHGEQTKLAKEYGVSSHQISMIVGGKSWLHLFEPDYVRFL
jgi:hypothetical protein